MSEPTHSPEFLAEFREKYGRYSTIEPDYSKCAKGVIKGMFGNEQCTRKNGNGPHGAWCKQHDPVASREKADARYADFKTRMNARQSHSQFQAACISAIRQIAAGHNDPAALARQIISDCDGEK